MTEAIITAVITGGVSLLGTSITVFATTRKTNENLRISQAVTDTKLEALTHEVRAHNDLAQRMPAIEEHIKMVDRRISDLEAKL